MCQRDNDEISSQETMFNIITIHTQNTAEKKDGLVIADPAQVQNLITVIILLIIKPKYDFQIIRIDLKSHISNKIFLEFLLIHIFGSKKLLETYFKYRSCYTTNF